jgi:hypothetical protein
VNKIVQRLKEPSTWAGLAVLALSLGLDPNKVAALGHVVNAVAPFLPTDGGVLAHAITAAAAGVAVVLPESKPAAQG